MDVVDLPLERLIPYARNPRKNESAVATVAASLREFGWRQPIVVDEEMVILAGHTRLEAARQLGLASAPVHIARGLTPAQARAYRLMDNRASENAEWDEALLGLELGDLQGDGFDLALTGFDDEELNRLLAALGDEQTDREGEDDVPETPADPVSRPGDLWILGNHRLLCGDSTVATDVERVLGGVTPLLMVSDPPYGVEYDPGWRNHAGAAKTRRTGKVLNDDRADWREAWSLFPGDVAYVWHGALHATTVAESLEIAGFAIRSARSSGRRSGWCSAAAIITGNMSRANPPARWCRRSSSVAPVHSPLRLRRFRSRPSAPATSSCPTIPTRASFAAAAARSPGSPSGSSMA